ncbi:hypothetical protein BDP55DRAFT_677550 [Colletotrichum godetiae]|uniref:Uncharacterized protein n=1 Tax=Colletotrichum godetiae TaxID=1209918 RepID=A0AAJ0ABP4_9PEZI|nr:uncharacterized protein BDP55DRAFT_677550 [Colletotrichum godetiae]KAK1660192.1 hypothetical protein BDP55DRAFT_677550 [Colletotrichum godetiae]
MSVFSFSCRWRLKQRVRIIITKYDRPQGEEKACRKEPWRGVELKESRSRSIETYGNPPYPAECSILTAGPRR